MKLFSGDRVIDAGSDPVGADSASSGSAPAVKSHAQGEMTLPPLPPIELPFIRKEPPPAPAPDASAMERILGPAPALPVACLERNDAEGVPGPSGVVAHQVVESARDANDRSLDRVEVSRSR